VRLCCDVFVTHACVRGVGHTHALISSHCASVHVHALGTPTPAHRPLRPSSSSTFFLPRLSPPFVCTAHRVLGQAGLPSSSPLQKRLSDLVLILDWESRTTPFFYRPLAYPVMALEAEPRFSIESDRTLVFDSGVLSPTSTAFDLEPARRVSYGIGGAGNLRTSFPRRRGLLPSLSCLLPLDYPSSPPRWEENPVVRALRAVHRRLTTRRPANDAH